MRSSKNEKMILVSERDVETSGLSLSEFFREKRKKLQDMPGEGARRVYYPMKKIAASLDISTDMLQQKLYRKKPLTRDWLIAISAAHGLDNNETDEALIKVGWPRLDADIGREDFIIEYLCNHDGDPNSLEEINCALRDNGYPELDTNNRKRKNNASDSLLRKYNIIRKVVRTYLDEGDQYDSLETAYDLRYRCVAVAFLKGDGKTEYVLEAFSDGHLSVTDKDHSLPKIYKSISETGEFKDYFSELITLVKQEQRRVNAQVNDSKNYQGRLGANLKNDAIHVFYEQFNYALPERNEYYLMEYVDGHYKLTVSHKSVFMTEYLPEDEYKKQYGVPPKTVIEVYNSIEDIVSLLSNRGLNRLQRELLPYRKSAFDRYSKIVNDALEKIKNRTLFIRNFEMIWEIPWDVCKYYGLEKEFDCICDNEYGDIILGKEEANLTDENGQSVTISFQELKRAFELGFTNSDQICRVKSSKGSIEEVL